MLFCSADEEKEQRMLASTESEALKASIAELEKKLLKVQQIYYCAYEGSYLMDRFSAH